LRVLVTGGSRGIGKDICDKFKNEGHEIIAPSREELDLFFNRDEQTKYPKIDETDRTKELQ
jgi:NAD(P)-dependent dehydrogenase (short-subunit alcohol dehydrogenase family)